AEPMLLIEIHKQATKQLSTLGEPVRLEFITEITDHTSQTVFGRDFTDVDEGMTFDASVDLVEEFEAALTAPTGRFAVTDGVHTPVARDVSDLWIMPTGTYTMTFHAPQLGHGLTGYNLIRVAHTIDQLDYFTSPGPSGGPRASIRQTVSLFGEPVPEPDSLFLLMIASLACLSRRNSLRTLAVN
ncbi:MAG TPA: PEP-CTERM sorting domain-containing protein, partial [Lacipirellulaceae bacterium]|nr:PEP-CTERM sorting domain-containing protein [Lacipirellulaceae bacterium]